MKSHFSFFVPIAACGMFFLPVFFENGHTSSSKTSHQKSTSEEKLFDTDTVLNITLKGDVRSLLNDRSDNPKDHPLHLSYFKEDGKEVSIAVQAKTRGHFRKLKGNCNYPPLLLQFPKNESGKATIFSEQSKLKLVMPCKGDEYVIREWLAYKIYNLVTPKSFMTRLVKVTLENSRNKRLASPFYGILIEEEKQMAKRNKCKSVEMILKPQQTQTDHFLRMAVFEYLIGNTDWSVEYLQNIKLLASNSNSVPMTVPYDFDHAGIVDAPYALPAEELKMNSVRERRYRGYCVSDMKAFQEVIAQYNQIKNDIYKLYSSCALLNARYIKSTIQYLDEFYSIINNPKQWQKEFAYPCDKNGTGNVIIKGIKTN